MKVDSAFRGAWSPALRSRVIAACLAVTLVLGLYSAVRAVWVRAGETITLAGESHGGVRKAPARPDEPAPGEALVAAARAELEPEDTWEVVTPAGRCLGPDGLPPGNNSPRIRYARHSFWLAFRLMPNAMDCTDPDVVVYWKRAAPDDGDVVADGEFFRIVRR